MNNYYCEDCKHHYFIVFEYEAEIRYSYCLFKNTGINSFSFPCRHFEQKQIVTYDTELL